LLSEAGPALYRHMIEQRDLGAFDDPALERALKRLRNWRNLALPAGAATSTVGERPWTDVVADFAAERAAMLITGDWARSELGAMGLEGERDFS
ncbi:carbohydrate ABC transporter substrate-binding protein, partial [Roseateles sp. DXS20W]